MAFSVQEVLSWTGGRWINESDLAEKGRSIQVDKPSELAKAGPRDLAFFFSRAYQKDLATAQPGILITAEPFVQPMKAAGLPLFKNTAVIACADPYYAMAVLSEKFAAGLSTVAHVEKMSESSVHSSAVIDPTAEIGKNVTIGAHCVVEAGARIGEGTVLYPGCFVGPEVSIGRFCVLFPNVVIYEWTEIGNRVRIHANSTIGSDGFGYAPRRQGKQVVGHQKIFHLGKVVIEDDVEIGANSCADRSTFGETRISKNAKLDNQVHIGHNCSVDEGAIICGATALAGRASVGKYAYVGGLVGITNDVHIGDGANVAALTLVSKDVPPGVTVAGNPQRELREHFKVHARLNRLLDERRKPAENTAENKDE